MLSTEILSYQPGDFNEISKFWNKLGLEELNVAMMSRL